MECCCQYHMMPAMSSMEPFHLLGNDDQTQMYHDILVRQCHWHQHHMMPMASSITPLHSLGQDENI